MAHRPQPPMSNEVDGSRGENPSSEAPKAEDSRAELSIPNEAKSEAAKVKAPAFKPNEAYFDPPILRKGDLVQLSDK